MTDRTQEAEEEVMKLQAIKDLNHIQAIVMLTTDGILNSRDLTLMQPNVDKLFSNIKNTINKI